MMDQGKPMVIVQMPPNTDLGKPHSMPPEDRWCLYFYWVHQYHKQIQVLLKKLSEKYQASYKQYLELREMEDIEVMRGMTVIGK